MPDLERVLRTSRLSLEPITVRHARFLFEYLSDDRLYRFHAGKPSSLEQLEQRFRGWQTRKSPDGGQTWLNYAVKRNTDDMYIGWVQATIAHARAIIGYDVFVPFWRQGYAKEACSELISSLFEDHGVTRLVAVVDVENVESIALLESLNFTVAWTGASEDMPGRRDYRYELYKGSANPPLP